MQVTLVVRVVWGRVCGVHASHAVRNGVGFWACFGSVDAAVSNKDAPLAASYYTIMVKLYPHSSTAGAA